MQPQTINLQNCHTIITIAKLLQTMLSMDQSNLQQYRLDSIPEHKEKNGHPPRFCHQDHNRMAPGQPPTGKNGTHTV